MLQLASGNTLGTSGQTVASTIAVNGGTIIETPANANGNNTVLGPLQLNGGTLTGIGGGGNATYQGYEFGGSAAGSVQVTGATNSYITYLAGAQNYGFQLATSNTFSVAGPGNLIVRRPLDEPATWWIGCLDRDGPGTMVLNSSDTYTGPTTIAGGTIQLGNVNALQTTVVTDNGGLTFSSGLGTANLGGLSGSGNIALTDLGDQRRNAERQRKQRPIYHLLRALSGSGGLNNAGGTLVLTNSNSLYGGPTTITGGALVLGNVGVLSPLWSSWAISACRQARRSASRPAATPASSA